MRTKTVYPTGEVPHLWAHQKVEHARNPQGNLYFNGRAIYSYGSHYCIAVISKIDSDYVIYNSNKSTNTTMKQKWDVLSAVSHKKIIYADKPIDADNGIHEVNLKDFEYRASEPAGKIAKAKKPEKYFNEIAEIRKQFNDYVEHFKIKKFKKKDFPNLFLEMSEKAIKEAKEREVKAQANRAKREAKLLEEFKHHLQAWKECKTYRDIGGDSDNYVTLPYIDGIKQTFLRILPGGMIETSKNIKFGLDAGKRFYGILQRLRDNGGCNGNCGDKKILDYTITEVNDEHLVIGCHDILWTEANNIAKQLNWI